MMPRGKRKPALQTIGEKIAKIDFELENHKKKISSLQAEKKNLLEREKNLQMEALFDTVQESGKSLDDIINFVKVKA